MAKGRPKLSDKPVRASINIQVLESVKDKLRELHTASVNSDVAVISDLIEKEHARRFKNGKAQVKEGVII
jgi:hypothetical protein